MFKVEILDGEEWKLASEHTNIVDAEKQVEIFKAGGVLPASIRITEVQ